MTPIKSNWCRANSLSVFPWWESTTSQQPAAFKSHFAHRGSILFYFSLSLPLSHKSKSIASVKQRPEDIHDQVSGVDSDHTRSWWTTVIFDYATMSMSDEEFDVVTARLPRVSSSAKPWWQPVAGGLNGGRCGDDSIGSPPCTGPPVSSSIRSSRCDMLRLVASSVTARSGIYGRKTFDVL